MRNGRGTIRSVVTLVVGAVVALQLADLQNPLTILGWFVGSVVLHDLVLFPLYTAADRLAQRLPFDVNVVRVPALLSGLLFLLWFPLILGRAPALYESITGVEQPDYLTRWLLVTAGLFTASALAAAASHLRTRHRAAPTDR